MIRMEPVAMQRTVDPVTSLHLELKKSSWFFPRKAVENFINRQNFLKSQEEAQIKQTQEAQAEKLKRLGPKSATPFLQSRSQPDKLCSCPLTCDTKFSKEQKKTLHEDFRDKFSHFQQNKYIQRHLKIKSQGLEDKGKRNSFLYLIPTIGSAKESNRHARTLNCNTVAQFLDTSVTHRNGFRPNMDTTRNKLDMSSNSPVHELTSELSTRTGPSPLPMINGVLDLSPPERRIENGCNGDIANSPASANDDDDSDSVKSADAESTSVWDFSDDDDSAIDYSSRVRYVGVCQKAFMNMYGITEKRIRWQRDKLLHKMAIKSQVLAEERLEEAKERRKEAEEKNRVMSVARSLGAGCKPLVDLMSKTNCDHMFPQLVLAIADDVDRVNNFFRNQLWKVEDMMDTSVDLADSFSTETDSDQMKL